MLEEDDIDDDDIYGNPSYRPTVIRSRTASRSKPVGKWIHSKSQEKKLKLRFCDHLIQFFLLIPNMVTQNHKMHLNPSYDQKNGLDQPTQFWKNF